MLEYGINFNTEEGAKKALKEIEDWGKKWQAALSKNSLKLDFDSTDKSGVKKTESNIKSISAQLSELRKEFRALEFGPNLESDGRVIIDLFKDLKKEAGSYANSLDSVAKKEDAASSDSLSTKLRLLSNQWNELSISQRKGVEGLSLILQFNNLSKEADQYAGSLSKVAALHNSSIQAKTVSQELSELTNRWDQLSIAQRRGAEGRAVIESFKQMTSAAGVYIGSIRDVIAEEERISKTDPLKSRLSQLESQWEVLSVEKRRGAEGRVILDNYKQIQESAGIYLGSVREVLAEEKRASEETKKKEEAQKRSTEEVNKQTASLRKQSEVLTQLKSYAMNFLSVYGSIRLAKSIVEITGEFEAQRMSLQAILRDAEKGEAIFERIKTLAVISPYTFKDLVSYTKQLSAFSVPYEELYDTTKMLADAAAGLGVDMSRLILAYGQVRSAAVLRGQELRQFTEAGIPLVDELAKKFTELKGEVVSASEVFDLISQRQVSFGMVKDIFAEMTGEGGKFYKMQEKLADTLKGKVSNLTDAFQIMLAEIGEKGSGVLKGAIDSTRWLMENYEKTGGILLGIVATYGTYKTALVAVSAAEFLLNTSYASKVKWLRLVVATQTLLNRAMMANPYALAAAALVGLVSVMIAFKDRTTAAEKAQEALNKRLQDQQEYVSNEREEVEKLINSIKNETSTRVEKQLALTRLQRMYPDIFQNLDIETLKNMELAEAIKGVNEQNEKRVSTSDAGRIAEIDRELSQKRAWVEAGVGHRDTPKEIKALEMERRGLINKRIEKEKAAAAAEFESLSTKEKIAHLEKENLRLMNEQNMMRRTSSQEELDVYEKQILLNDQKIKQLKISGVTAEQEIQNWLKALKDLDEEMEKVNKDERLTTSSRTNLLEDIEERRKVFEDLLKSRGWKEVKESEINKAEKKEKDRIKKYLDGIQDQVEEYKKKFEIWDMIYQGTGKKPEISFDATFDGEPDLVKYIKSKMQEIGGGKIKLDIDFLTTGFSEILGDSKLDEQTKEALKKMFLDIQNIYVSENKEIQSLYDKYASYIIKKQKLDETYQKERDKLAKSGAAKDILDEQLNQYVEASNKLATEFAEQDLEFNKFVNEMAEKSIEELGSLLMKIDEEMSKMIDEGGDTETIAMLRARVVELEKLLRQKTGKSEKESKATDSYKDWKKLQTMLSKVDKELQDIGDNIGGTAGEIIGFARNVTSSTLKMINGIIALAKEGASGIKTATDEAATSIKTLEKASVILAIISAALQLANAIKGLLDNKEQKEYINQLEEDRNAIAREYNKILLERIAIEDSLFGGNKMQNMVNTMKAYSQAIENVKGILSEMINIAPELGNLSNLKVPEALVAARKTLMIQTEKERKVLGITVKGAKYENLEEWVRKTLGAELYQEDGWLDLDVAKQVAGMSQLDKKTKEYLETLISAQESVKELRESIEEMIDDTFGELGDSLTNSIVEGFRNGSLAAEDFKNDVTSVLEDVAAQMVRMLFLQDFIDKYKTSLADIYEDYAAGGSKEKYMEDLMSSTAEFYGSASKAWGEASEFLTMFQDIGKKNGFDLFALDKESNLTGLSKAAASLTEDQALLLGGYLDSIRFKLFPYIDYMLTEHRTTMGDMLSQQVIMTAHLIAIEANTKVTADTNTEMLKKISDVIVPSETGKGYAVNVNA